MPQIWDYSLDYKGRPRYFLSVYRGENAKLRAALKVPGATKHINTPIFTQGGQTLAHVAVMGSAPAPVETVQILKEAGADLFTEDNAGRMPWDIAANTGDPKVLSYFLSLPMIRLLLVGHPDVLDRTPLHALCLPGSSPKEKRRGEDLVASLNLLLGQYISVTDKQEALQRPDAFGISPLRYAKYYGFTEIIAECVKQGLAVESEITDIGADDPALDTDYWGRPKSKLGSLQEAAFDRQDKKVEELLLIPCNANNPTLGNYQFDNMNSLHYAASNGTPETVQRELADRRVNPLAVTNSGRTALHLAAHRGNKPVLAALLQNPTSRQNINLKDQFVMTPLHALAMSNSDTSLECLELLILNGADPFVKNKNGDTPYDVAVKRGNSSIARKLAEYMRPRPGLLWSYVFGGSKPRKVEVVPATKLSPRVVPRAKVQI